MPLNIDWQQILLHLLNFSILFAVLYFLLYKPVKKFIENREQQYKNMDEETKQNLAEAKQKNAEYSELLDKVQDEISKQKARAKRETDEICEAKLSEAEAQAKKIIGDARHDAAAEKSKILGEVEAELPDIVTKAVQKLALNPDGEDGFDEFLSKADGSDKNE